MCPELIWKYFADPRATSQYERFVSHDVLVVVEVAEEFLSIFVYIFRLFQQTRAQEIVKDLPQLRMALQVADMLFFDRVFDGPEICLQLGVKIFVALHFET